MESTTTDELGEDSDVILEVGFDGRAWICLSSLREVQWSKRDRGGEVIVLGFVGEEENGLIWRALAAAIWVGCVVFV